MASSIVSFWRECDGAIHPADVEILSTAPCAFNLDYPPPAYLGDIENAPLVLLNGNGGYKPEMTRNEFVNPGAIRHALDLLHHPKAVDLKNVSDYYRSTNYSDRLQSGELAMVNAVAYRSPTITREIRQIAPKLVSTQVHIQWFERELLPAARAGRRLIIAHRYGLWRLDRRSPLEGLHFTSSAVSKNLPNQTLAAMNHFLANMS